MQYRREIDGLRAVAVLPVILFHAGFSVFSGGYVGVDVFFVISGYLITSILIGELEQGNFSILRFYERRARRILPALFVVMLACLPFAYMWMLPSQLEDFAQSLVAVSLFLSNWLFWSEASYFASATELKPLLHTWSLAVEEQYYLMFPLLLLLCWRIFRPFTFGFIFLLAAMSFLLAEWGWRNEPEINFYFTFSRFWELLVGSMCAFLTVGQKQRSSNFLGAIGIALIISAIFYYDENTPFPSAYALVPVVGTALIILFADKTTWTARLLSTRGFVGVGLISYSAYLWHQPLFAFARIRSLTEPSHYLMALLAAAALLLAWVTWRWVEQPFRNRANPILVTRRSVFAASGAVGAIFVAIGFSVDQGEGLEGRWSDVGIAKFFENYEAKHMRKECFLTSGRNEFSMYDQATCLPVSDSIKNVLIVGDSHGAHLAQAMIDEYPDLNILHATSSGCTALLPLDGAGRCTDLFDFIYNEFLPNNTMDIIVLSSRVDRSAVASFSRTIRELLEFSERIIVVGPVPEYNPVLWHSIAKSQYYGSEYDSEYLYLNTLKLDRFEVDSEVRDALEGIENSYYYSVLNEHCSPLCPVYSSEGELWTFDYGHLTYSSAVDVVRSMGELLR